jgi:hypothetical protein
MRHAMIIIHPMSRWRNGVPKQRKLQQLRKKQPNIKPVIIAGNALATTRWGSPE